MEVRALAQPALLLQQRLPPGAGGADRERRLVDDERVGGQVLADVVACAVHPPEVGVALAVDEERYDDHDGVDERDCLGVLGGRAQAARWHQPGKVVVEVVLPGEGCDARR